MIVIVMGVSGSGKTTVGKRLARELEWRFHDGDEFHPADNIEKMKGGKGLSDQDRRPWLEALKVLIDGLLQREENAIIACSALKDSYRKQLTSHNGRIVFVYLKGSYDLIRQRIIARQGHFMKADLLRDQFAVLEEPADAIVVDIQQEPAAIVDGIKKRLAEWAPS